MKRRRRPVVSFNMSRVRGKDTKPELLLRQSLHSLGLRYRTHVKLPGRPDILLSRSRLAVFVDGAFWHGRQLHELATQLHVRRRFWLAKIQANVDRDRRNESELRRLGYTVIRFWDDEILKAPARCADRVVRAHNARISRRVIG